MQAELDHQRWRHLRQALKHLVVPEVIDPVQGWLATEHAAGVQDQVARHSSEHERDHQQHHQRQSRLQERMLFKGAPEVLGVEPELFDIHKRNVSSIKTRGAIRAFKTLRIAVGDKTGNKKPLIVTVCTKKLGLSARNR